jgi:hypothetical protein
LKKSPAGRKKALALYAQAKPLYHPIAQTAIERVLFFEQEISGEQRIDP